MTATPVFHWCGWCGALRMHWTSSLINDAASEAEGFAHGAFTQERHRAAQHFRQGRTRVIGDVKHGMPPRHPTLRTTHAPTAVVDTGPVPAVVATAAPLGTAFTYQGQLKDNGQAATGLYDLQFCLFDTPSNPIPLGCAADQNDVPVDTGLFTVTLDFGSAVFSGQERYLELRVRPGASTGGYTQLSPRQLMRPTPEALRANAAAAAPWSGLTGVPAGFADGTDDIGGGGTVTSITAGDGLSGGTFTTSGTLAVDNTVQRSGPQPTCPSGQVMKNLAQDGTATCVGAVSSVAGGGGITASTSGSAVTLGTDSTVQRRSVAPSCPAGQVLTALAQDGTPSCVASLVDASSGTSHGVGVAPASGSTWAYLSTTRSVNVAAGKAVFVTGSTVLNTGASSGFFYLNVCWSQGGPLTPVIGSSLSPMQPANSVQMFTTGAAISGLAQGTYSFGLCGYTSTFPSPWTGAGLSWVTALVL